MFPRDRNVACRVPSRVCFVCAGTGVHCLLLLKSRDMKQVILFYVRKFCDSKIKQTNEEKVTEELPFVK